MARKKEFEREIVLERAMNVFWAKGYEATSIQDLVDAMGINRASLYNTFQDKQHLFNDAIAYYIGTIINPVLERLSQPNASRQAIVDHFQSLIQHCLSDATQRGCLMTNTIIEMGLQEPIVAFHLKASLDKLESAFITTLKRAQDQGEISPNKDITALASYLVTSMQGLRVMAKLDPNPHKLQTSVTTILSALD